MNKLENYRDSIDDIDREIVKLLLLRFGIVEKISEYKKKNGIKITDRKRERQVIANAEEKSGQHRDFASKLFKSIIEYSKNKLSRREF